VRILAREYSRSSPHRGKFAEEKRLWQIKVSLGSTLFGENSRGENILTEEKSQRGKDFGR
jgi:hypothetical protein